MIISGPVLHPFIFVPSFPPSSTIMEWLLLAASHTGSFSNIFRNFVGLLRMSDQPVAKASTYTLQRTQKEEDKHPFLERNSNHGPSVQAMNAYA
jgi:hypothetical protein